MISEFTLGILNLDNVSCKRNAIRFPQIKIRRIAYVPDHFSNQSIHLCDGLSIRIDATCRLVRHSGTSRVILTHLHQKLFVKELRKSRPM